MLPHCWLSGEQSRTAIWRALEWERELAAYVANNDLPTVTLPRLMHDHTGNFGGETCSKEMTDI